MNLMTATGESARNRLLAGLPVGERSITAAGVGTALLAGGEGPAMVLLHGPGEFAGTWSPVLGDLARSHLVVAPDLPGHGDSAAPAGGITHDWMDRWLADVIAATCDRPPVLVGRVVGGAIGAAYAARHPAGLAGLVLVDTTGLAPFDPDPRFGLAMHRFLSGPSLTSYERFMDFCAFDLDTARSRLGARWEAYAEYAVHLAGDPRVQAAIGSLIGLYGTPIDPAMLAAIGVPTSLIWGRSDAATPVAVAERAAARYGWPLRVIDRTGDDPALDRPDEFIATLLDLVDEGGSDGEQ